MRMGSRPVTETMRGCAAGGGWEWSDEGAVTQARNGGPGAMERCSRQVARPFADWTRGRGVPGAVAADVVDGMEWDVPGQGPEPGVFGVRGDMNGRRFHEDRVVTVARCGSHDPGVAVMGTGGRRPRAAGRQSLAGSCTAGEEGLAGDRRRKVYKNGSDGARGGYGAALLWRMKENSGAGCARCARWLPNGRS